MKAKIDLDKFVRSLVERYYEKIHIDPTTTKCWLDSVLEDQGLEYKGGEIVEIGQESEDERIRKELIDYINRLTVTPNNIDRYNSWIAWLEKQVQSTTITIPKDLKGTDTDGGVVGEKGEQGEQPTEEEMVGMGELGKAWKEDSKEDAIIARLDKIYDLLLGRLPVFYPNYPFPYNPIIYKNQLDPDPNEPCGWETTASTEGGEE